MSVSLCLLCGSVAPSSAAPIEPDADDRGRADPPPAELVVLDISAVPQHRARALAFAAAGHDEEINAGTRQLVVTSDVADRLRQLGFDVRPLGPAEQPGPDWPKCYSSLDSVYEEIAKLDARKPELVEVVDIGDSFCKVQGRCITTGGDLVYGRDLLVVRITNELAPSPKEGRLWIDGGLHARELPTVELMIEMMEHLVAGYGHDPMITYLLDHREVHVGVVMNPDGRDLVELGTQDPYRGSPWYWRKNANNVRADRCSWPPEMLNHYGVDLNRNHGYQWDSPGRSRNPCAETYNGPAAVSEPESQSYESYLASIFPDQRGPAPEDQAPISTTGVMVNYHNATVPGKVLVPWGWSQSPTPNDDDLRAIARRYVTTNNYDVQHSLYAASGSTRDWAYGTLGIPAYVIELEGAGFFTPCQLLPGVIGHHVEPIKMLAGLVDRPYERIRGPEVTGMAFASPIASGATLTVTAALDESRAGGDAIAEAEVTIGRRGGGAGSLGIPGPGVAPGAGIAMNAEDGAFDEPTEHATAAFDTTGLRTGLHYVAVRAKDSGGHWGAIATRFITVTEPVPKLAIGISAPPSVTAGELVTYTLAITASYNTAPSVAVSDPLPPPLAFVGATDGGTLADGVVTWLLGDLAAGETRQVRVAARAGLVETETTIVNAGYQARFEGGGAVGGPPVATRIVPLPLLTIAKSGPSVVLAGTTLTYTLAVSVTRGPAYDVVVTDLPPPRTTFVAASHGGELDGGQVTWRLGDLAVGTTASVTLAVRAELPPLEGWLVNSDYGAAHSNGTGERGAAVVTRVRPAARLYVPRVEAR